jgi:hypothetical protein
MEEENVGPPKKIQPVNPPQKSTFKSVDSDQFQTGTRTTGCFSSLELNDRFSLVSPRPDTLNPSLLNDPGQNGVPDYESERSS